MTRRRMLPGMIGSAASWSAPGGAVGQPRMQPVPGAGPGGAVAGGVGDRSRVRFRVGVGVGEGELAAVLARAPTGAGRSGRCREAKHPVRAQPPEQLPGHIGQQIRQPCHVVAGIEDHENVGVASLMPTGGSQLLDDLAQDRKSVV